MFRHEDGISPRLSHRSTLPTRVHGVAFLLFAGPHLSDITMADESKDESKVANLTDILDFKHTGLCVAVLWGVCSWLDVVLSQLLCIFPPVVSWDVWHPNALEIPSFLLVP